MDHLTKEMFETPKTPNEEIELSKFKTIIFEIIFVFCFIILPILVILGVLFMLIYGIGTNNAILGGCGIIGVAILLIIGAVISD